MELKKVGEKIVEISRDEELRGWYDEEEHQRMVRNSLVSSAIKEGWNKGIKEGKEVGHKKGVKKGIKEGIKNEKNNVARKMLDENISLEIICKITGLKLEEVKALKK